jgi:hypothetical protein
MQKHLLYGLFTHFNYKMLIKKLKEKGHSKSAKELSKLNCMQLPIFLYRNRAFINYSFPSNAVDTLIYSMEHIWFHSERVVAYPRTVDEIEIMARSSFKNLDINSMKSGAMVIASPPGSSIPPMLIGYRNKESIEKFNEAESKQFGYPVSVIGHKTNSFTVIFNDAGTLDYLTYEIADKDIPAYALAKSTEEILDLVEKASVFEGNMKPTKEDFLKQASILKVALNFWLYRMANPEKFVRETPPAQAKNYYGLNVTQSYSLDFSDRIRANQEGSITEVGIHMRNLRHERYYTTPEWKDEPRGTRWIEIGPYTRGGRGEMLEDGTELDEELL